ncbi:MAG: hypothetical protein U9N73_10330 [Candidatus Auribacterota bacterium]|nr:hypothetical protein [Candidatus Auribacterota bacterium]
MRKITYFVLFVLPLVISLSCSQSPEDKAVTELLEKATGLVEEAVALRDSNPDEAQRLESEALSLLEESIFNYPSSSLVAELYEGKILVGPYTIHVLEDRVAGRMDIIKYDAGEEEVEVELDPLTRAGDLAGEPGPPYLKAMVQVYLADKYREQGDTGMVSGLLSGALSAAEVIEKDYFKSRALAKVSEQYKLSGEEDRALEILEKARGLAEEIKYQYFQSGVMREIVECYSGYGRFEEALEIVEEIKDPFFKAGALIEISSDYEDTDNPREAGNILLRAEEIAEEIDSPHFQAEILARLAARYISAGEKEKVAGLLATALEIAVTVKDPVSRSEALIEVGKGYAVVGETETAAGILAQAKESAVGIENNLFKDQILQEIAEQYIVLEEYDQASGIEETLEDPRSKTLVLVSLAESYNSSGDKEQSDIFVNRTLEAIEKIKNPLFQAEALIKISHLYQPVDPPAVEEISDSLAPTPVPSRSTSE